MPRFDRTGPNGEGSMTGRKSGLCTGNTIGSPGVGAGGGRGRGRFGRGGFGFRFMANAGDSTTGRGKQDTVTDIKNEIEAAREHLSELEERLTKIQKK